MDATVRNHRTLPQVLPTATEWHPRDPQYRIDGRLGPRPSGLGDRADSGSEDGPQDGTRGDGGAKRSDAAKAAMVVGIGGGLVQNAVDLARLVKKYPEAMRAGQFEPALGRMGRLPTAVGLTFLMRPDNRIVDPAAPRVASAASLGRSFTRFDELAMKTSVLMGTSLAALQIGASIPNLADALSQDGPWYENLAGTTSGRAGVLQLGGGLLGAGVFAAALHQTRGQGEGVIGRVLAAAKAPVAAKPMWGRIGLATGMVVMANELGYLAMLDKGEQRPVGQVLSDAAHRTPVLNDPSLRTAVLLGTGGAVGFKAVRAAAASGAGIRGVGAGYWIAGAAVAGLLGTQLLGGLHGLDKPA